MNKTLKSLIKFFPLKICRDIAEWQRNCGGSVINIHAPVVDEAEKAARLDPRIEFQFKLRFEDLSKHQTLQVIQNPIVCGCGGLVVLPDGKFVLQGNWDARFLKSNPNYSILGKISNAFLRGDYYSLLSHWGAEYYHWFHDVLPRLIPALPHLPGNIRFLINHDLRNYQIRSLEALGISREHLVFQSSGSRQKIERLWFASPLGNPEFSSSRVLAELSKKIRRACTVENGDQPQRIFISRRLAERRRLVNENEIIAELRRLGFVDLALETMPFDLQVKTMASASIVCGLHGAGLTNILFCQTGARVAEISSPIRDHIHYQLLSHKLGHRYFSFNQVEERCGESEPDFYIDVPAFRKWISELIREQ